MKVINYKGVALFEHKFWLQILGDHSRFIFNALPSKSAEDINRAQYFIELFDNLLSRAWEISSDEDVGKLNLQAQRAAADLRGFKLKLLQAKLTDGDVIALPPTFINHMLNEIDEYILILDFILSQRLPSISPLHYHLLWLPDGAGHAAAIMSNLDETEKKLFKVSRDFNKAFSDLYMKALEFKGYTRTDLFEFPALDRLNAESEGDMIEFKKLLLLIKEGVVERRILGNLTPLMPDHMYREECYYLTKLSEVSNIKPPQCDPTKPRVV